MKTCPACGQPMEDFEIFCGACGAKYEAPAQGSDADSVTEAAPAPETVSAPVVETTVPAPVAETAVVEVPSVVNAGVEPAVPAGGPAFCPGCGERLPPAVPFCPNCGRDLRAGEDPALKGRKSGLVPKVLGVVAACAAVAVIVAGAVNLIKRATASPADAFLSYQEEALERLAKGWTGGPRDSFSTDMILTVDVSGGGLGLMRGLLNDSSIGLKVDADDHSILANADLTLMGSKVLEGAALLNDDTLSFSIPQVDSNCYEVDLEALIREAMEEAGVDLSALAAMDRSRFSEDDLRDIGERYGDIFKELFTKDSVTKSSEKTVQLGELRERLDGTVYIFKPQRKDVEKVLAELADAVEDDDQLRDVAVVLMERSPYSRGMNAGMDLGEAYDQIIKELARQMRDNAGELAKMVEAADVTWTVGVSKGKLVLDTIQISGMTLGYENSGDEILFYAREGEWSYYGVRVVKEESGKRLSGYVTLEELEDGYESLRFLEFEDVDASTRSVLGIPYGRYTMTVPSGEQIALEVTKGAKGGSDHTVSFPLDTGYGTSTVKVTLNTTDKKSTAQKPSGEKVAIRDMYELRDVMTNISDQLEYLVGDLAGGLF